MAETRLVIVAHDGWVLRLLRDGLRERGYVVTTATTAKDGYDRVCALSPDVLLCDVPLRDHDGYWLAARIRSENSEVSAIPVLLISPEDDDRARLRSFDCGADAFMTRPFRLDEVVAQINALVVMSRRLRAHRRSMSESLGPPSSSDAAAFQGDLEHLTLPTLLAILEMERRTGRVSVRGARRRAVFDFSGGFVSGAALDDADMEPVEVLRVALGWTKGRFSFRAESPTSPEDGARPIRALIAEARAVTAPKNPAPPKPATEAPKARKPALAEQPTRKLKIEVDSPRSRAPASRPPPSRPPASRPPASRRAIARPSETKPPASRPPNSRRGR